MNLPTSIRELTIAHPNALYLLIAVALIAAWWFMQADSPRRAIAPVMRALALALFVLALADPQTVLRFEGSTRPVLLDLSNSITPVMRQFDANLLAEQLKLRANDPAIMFGSEATSANVSDALAILKGNAGCKNCRPEATDLESALSRLASDPDAAGGPAVLVTDGWQNRGDADNAIGSLVAARIPLYVFTPPGAEGTPDVAMTELMLPKALSKAEPFALGVTMANLNAVAASGTIQVYENNRLLDERPVAIIPGQQRFDFPVRSENTGLVSYKAVFKPADPSLDIYRENDSLEGWVGIGARRRVLIIADKAKDASYLETIVRRLGLEPTVVALAGRQFTGNASGYDAVILDNVPRARLSPDSQRALASYVERGGSLAMVGGDESFGLGGYGGSEIADVMPVVMKPPEHREQRRALLLIIDTSGSMMREHKIDYAKAAAKTVTKALKDDDLVGVIGFASQPTEFVPLQPLKDSRPYFDELIDRIRPGGQTFLLPALKEAERDLAASRASLKHVVILTDGKTGGTLEQYYDLVSSMHRDGGVTISSIAIGRDADLRFLTEISKYGGGGLYQTDSPQTLPEIFLQDVKKHGGQLTMVEKEFAPIAPSPDPVLKDLAGRRLPPLKGYVSTQLKPHATMDLFVNRNGVREPVVASWKVGSGKALAVTTDASGRWSAPWITSGVFGQVWNRLLSWMTPETAPEQNFDVALGYHSGRLDLKLTDYSEHPELSARLVSAIVTGPDNARSEVILSEDAPGELSGSVEASKPGTYYITLKSTPDRKERTFPPLAYTVSPAAFAEIPRPSPNYDLLEHLASATGGRLNPSPSELALSRPTIERRTSLAAWPIVLAMLLLIGEALVRRLTA
jgi:Ca-activated chloride channel homolog